MSSLTTEAILTHPDAFGLLTATPTQRAICRALDGLSLGSLAEDPDVQAAFGGREALALLPSTRPREAHIIASIRSAKSQIAAAHIIRSSQTVDMSRVGIGDIVRHFVVALKLDGTRAVLSHLVAQLLSKPLLRSLVAKNAKGDLLCDVDGVVLLHPSGRRVEVTPIPLDRAGGSVLSVYSAGITVDEEPRMLGSADAVKNLDDVRHGVMGRLLDGAQYFGIGSPHAPSGPLFEAYERHFGRPSNDVVIAQAPGPAMNPVWWTPERCAALERVDPRAHKTDVLAQFADGVASVFASDAISGAVRLAPENTFDCSPIIALDMSSGRGDSAVAIPLAWVPPLLPREAFMWTGYSRPEWVDRSEEGHGVSPRIRYIPVPQIDEEGEPIPNPEWKGERHPVLVAGSLLAFDGKFARSLPFDALIARIAGYAHRVGALYVVGDQHLEYALLPEFRKHGVKFKSLAWTSSSKEAAIDRMRMLFRDRRVIIPDDLLFRRELGNFAEKPRPAGGYSYEARRGHDDRVMAFALGCAADIEGLMPRSPIAIPKRRVDRSLEERELALDARAA